MNFLANEKTIEYMNILVKTILKDNKNETLIKMRELSDKIIKLNKKISFYKYYDINNTHYILDRNIIAKLKNLSIAVSHIENSKIEDTETFFSDDFIKMYSELIEVANDIKMKYSVFKGIETSNIFFLRPNDLFISCLKIKTHNKKIKKTYFELVHNHIDELETMAYVLINHLEEVKYDIESYSTEYCQLFLSMDDQDPEI